MKKAGRIQVMTLFSSMVATLAGASAQAQPISPITILEGGYTEYCSMAARNPGNLSSMLITGTRNPLSPVEICTLAIREGGAANRAVNHSNRGVLHFAAGDSDAALADFDEAVRLDDTLVLAHINRGYIFNLREQWEQAISAFDRAIELGIEPGEDLAAARGDVEEPGEPRRSGAVPEMARVHYNRGIAHEELEHAREAYLDYLKAAELASEWEEPQRELERFEVR